MYRRWRVYSTFFTGLLIGLGFAVLMGMPMEVVADTGEAATDWNVFVLVMFGILGGVIYPIVTDGYIEMPRFVVNQGGHFKAGLFGDILLGIAGATILELLLPPDMSMLSPEGETLSISSTAVAATGIIGGYGGRAILRFALARVVETGSALERRSRERGSRERGSRAWGVGRGGQQRTLPPGDSDVLAGERPAVSVEEGVAGDVSAEMSLSPRFVSVLMGYFRQGDTEQSLLSIKQQIVRLPVDRLQALFDFLVEQRDPAGAVAGRKVALASAQLERMIPVFEAIAQRGWQEHQCEGQIALIYTQLASPNYGRALVFVERAIAARGPLVLGQPWNYELHRAAIRIAQSQANKGYGERLQSEIMGDLLSVARVYNLETILASDLASDLRSDLALGAAPSRATFQLLTTAGSATAAQTTSQSAVVLAWLTAHQALLAAGADTRILVTASSSDLAPFPNSLSEKHPKKLSQNPQQNLPAFSKQNPPANPNNYRLANRDRVVGQGFNLLSLDPFNISGSAKQDTIFEFYDGEALEIEDEGRKLHPKGTKYSAISHGGLSENSQTSVLYTEADAQRLFASRLGGLAAKILGRILPCSLSGSYEKIKRERSVEKQIYSFTQADYRHYRLDLLWDAPEDLHLDGLFCRAVAQLPFRENLSVGVSAGGPPRAVGGKEILPYLDFIEKYGTHVAVQVHMGGLVHQRISLSESLYASVVNKGASLEAEAKKMFTARVASASESSTYQEIRDHSEHLQFCGGMMECDNIFEWFGTVKGDPAPVKVALRSLHEVLSPAFFPTDPTIFQKQALLADVIQHYLEETSEPPAWELWRSVAVGGDGGKAFSSIDCAPIFQAENQARYAQAQVAEVRVKIGSRWIGLVEGLDDGLVGGECGGFGQIFG
ncbi:MAG: MAC/perforin domain-containing protein, partial [Cyanobacteria bacterium J06598_3]